MKEPKDLLRKEELEVYGDEDDDFVLAICAIAGHFDIDHQRVLYPGSNAHAGVARAFGKDRVLHVDPDPNAIKALVKAGFEAVESTKEDYTPEEPFDVIVSYNAGTLEPPEPQRLLTPFGFVIANNWHGSANRMVKYKDFTLRGAILPSFTDGAIVMGEAAAEGLGIQPVEVEGAWELPQSPDGLFVFQRQG